MTLCPFVYGSPPCGQSEEQRLYFGPCGKTFADCRRRGNQARFGGEPPPAYRCEDPLAGCRGVLISLAAVLLLAALFVLGLFL